MTDTVKAWIQDRRAARVPNSTLSISDAHNNLPRALNAIEQVLELHKPVEHRKSWEGRREKKTVCEECTSLVNKFAEWEHEKTEVEYPCPTVQAIEGAINE